MNIPNKLFTQKGDPLQVERLTNAINDILDYLQAKEEANKCQCRCHSGAGNFSCVECESKHDMRDLYKQPEEASKEQYIYTCSCSAVYDPELKNCPACGEKTIYNGKYLCYTCNQWGIVGEHKCEASKGECNCLCHFDRKPTPEEYAVSSCYGCKHCRSNPPEHEESWDNDLWQLVQKIHKEHRAVFPQLHIFIRDNFVNKEKIKRAIEDAADCVPGTRGRTLDAIIKSLGLGD